jgi:hypothetical protein
MGYYDPPEAEMEGDDTFTCSAEVTRKFVTPDMETVLKRLADDYKGETLLVLLEVGRDLSTLVREWRQSEEWTGTCGWEGETSYAVWNGAICWECPSCGEEHSDEQAFDRWGPDPDAYRDEVLESIADRSDESILAALREDEGS